MTTGATVYPRVFLDVQIGTEPVGRIVIELFVDKAPKTCENFRALCTASHGPELSYKLSIFHRVVDEFIIQGGDITRGDGTGGRSIYGGDFEDDAGSWRKVDKEGLVCMANRGKGTDTNSSQFFITLAPCDQVNAVFGQLVSGQNVLSKIALVRVDKNDRPIEDVVIANCGELERRSKQSAPAESQGQTHSFAGNDPETARGRKRRRRDNDDVEHAPVSPPQDLFRSRSRSPRPKYRRRDSSLDSNLRGRGRLRSASRDTPVFSQMDHSMREWSQSPRPTPRHPRRRSQSPSRSHTPSRSPRRRRHRSRSHPRPHGHVRSYRDGYYARADEDLILREELEREGGRERYEGLIEDDDDGDDDGRDGWRGSAPGNGHSRRSKAPSHRDGRLDGGEQGDVGTGEVRFKGRGRMNYRERR